MQKKVLIGIVILVILGVLTYIQISNTNSANTQSGQFNFPTPSNSLKADGPAAAASSDATISAKLEIQDIKVGTGSAVKAGNTIKIHYTGTLTNGQKFDSSIDRGQPFETQIGVGKVIKGWDLGVVGMKTGGKRKLIIPPDMGYGAQGMGNVIPPNATLIFDLELLGIK